MGTIYDLKRRAKELAAATETNAVDPAKVGNLIDDTLELIDEYDKNVVGLGIRKTYATVATMEADRVAPGGDDGKMLRFGQLVSVYDAGNRDAVDNGKVFAFQKPGWKLASRVDAGYVRKEEQNAVLADQTDKNVVSAQYDNEGNIIKNTYALKSLLGEGYLYAGVATVSTNPNVPKGNVFYIAYDKGIYKYFNNILIHNASLLKYENDTWSKVSISNEIDTFLIGSKIYDWAGGDAILYIDYIYRNDVKYGSGVRVLKSNYDYSDPVEVAYWSGLRGDKSGIEKLPEKKMAGNVGKIKIIVDWNTIPSGFNKGIDKIIIPHSSLISSVESTDLQERILNVDTALQEQNDLISDLRTDYLDSLEHISEIERVANEANSKMITEESTTWRLVNDVEFFTSQYAYRHLGQYTKVMKEHTAFSQILLNKVNFAGDVRYKICIVKGIAKTLHRDCPVGPISTATHTVIKEGTLTLTNGYKDYYIDLGNIFVCPIGSQVAIYMVALSAIAMRGSSNGSGNLEKTSNVALLSVVDNPFDGGHWGAGSVYEITNTGFFNVALTLRVVPVFATKNELQSLVQREVEQLVPEYIKPDIKLTIPDKVYAVVGTELNLWNDAVSLSVDKGLYSPLNYQIRWYCTKGLITDRCFRFIPTDGDVGTVTCTCYLYDTRNSLIESKVFQIRVLAKNALSTLKRCVYFGDSLGGSVATSLIDNFNNSEKYTGVIPVFLGTRGSGIKKYEAVGGYRWVEYATAGRCAYRVVVGSVASVSVGAKYNLENYPNAFEIREVNMIDGIGNLLIEYQYGIRVTDFPETGVLKKASGAGDDVLSYTGGGQEPNNPLWNTETNSLDIALYRTKIGLSSDEKIDAVSFQFGINDSELANNLTLLMQYINDLYNAFIVDNPKCRFIIGLTTSSGNDLNGSGANYGASQDWLRYLINTYKIRQFYLTLQNSAQYPNIVVAPIALGVDRYYGYNFSDRPISQRYTITEKYHNNYVHPGASGYGQMADVYLSSYIASLLL